MTDPRNQPVLVHCAAGAERTGAAMILYRHAMEAERIIDAYREATEFKTSPTDNWVMLAYIAEWNDEIERAFREGGTIPGVPAVEPRVGGCAEPTASQP
jgi:protein tyrosine/serine phosphatase